MTVNYQSLAKKLRRTLRLIAKSNPELKDQIEDTILIYTESETAQFIEKEMRQHILRKLAKEELDRRSKATQA